MADQEAAAPPPENVSPNLQHPTDVLHTVNLVSQLLAAVLVSFFMVLRLYVKTSVEPPYHTDDWMALIAWILSLGYNAAAFVDGYYGGGFHIYEISKGNFKGPHRRTTIVAFAVVTLLTGYTVPIVFIKALICRPVAGFWDPAIKATCYNQRAIYVADTAVSTISDMAVLFLPVPVVMTLQMSWNKRLQVIAMLSSGGLAAVASLVRTILVIKLQTSQDETLDLVRFNLLGTAEVGIGSQRMIATEVAPEVVFRGFITPVLAEQGRNGCIFPFERALQRCREQRRHLLGAARCASHAAGYAEALHSPPAEFFTM
ncbi:hypothetical protein Cob_v010881 [Colletotrichum orbiculare MAFF 240422]|uniref:Rhodopsin domain-containing protein n=1 Tax=Colletotrichum orbiculare (strain 104-T / ATCC 96160 / CBS 514.97 / LARS 414 / MAFF 240422) TaxID=1213857 RepID=A0A484FD00_COLOR|nr:hypothetical protein Cob_v010881 [Colletotrichum orbiculare MAFF 240422]